MRTGRFLFSSVATLAVLVPAMVAQEPERALASDAIAGVHGLSRSGDDWVGLGPSYRAEFGVRGLVFSPVLGEHAEVDATWRFELEHVRRGEGAEVRAGASERLADSDRHTMRYARPGVVETYQVREEGVELSFVFDDVPTGSGDLVVRGRVGTALPLVHAASDELRFESEWGGVRVGAVTGIDARGATARGSLRYADGALEMVLPAAFVDAAEAPLVLDPLIETAGTLVTQDVDSIDIAYNSNTGIYLAVWRRWVSGSDSDVIGQRIRADRTPVGGPVRVDIGTNTLSHTPKVCLVRSRNAFVVAYHERESSGFADILVRTVDAAGEVSAAISVGNVANERWLMDISGNVTPTGDIALITYDERTQVEQVGVLGIRVDASATPSLAGDQVIHSNGLLEILADGALPAHGGPSGRYLVTWTKSFQFSTMRQIEGAVVDANLDVLVPAMPLTDVVGPEEERTPAVDGDGSQWLLAYREGENTVQVFRGDIGGRRVTYDPVASSLTLGPRVLIASSPDSESDPRVVYTGGSYLVSYQTQQDTIFWCGPFGQFAFTDVRIASVDPFTCAPCEGEFQVQGTAGNTISTEGLVICGQWDGTPQGGPEALLAWIREDVQGIPVCTVQESLQVQRFRSDDGLVTDLGGGCGGGGAAFATCAVQGNAGFTLRVEGAAPATPAFVALSGGQLGFPCGPCTIVADLGNGVAVGIGSTDANGDASAALPLPNLPTIVGVPLINQWLFIPPAGACFGVDMSNALQIVIQ